VFQKKLQLDHVIFYSLPIIFLIVAIFFVGGFIYLFSKKEEEEKEKAIDSPYKSKPYALA
jgi:hypothetical protein